MKVVDTVISLFSLFWIPKAEFYYFYAAQGDSIIIKVNGKREIDGVYFGKYEQRPKLSEVYIKELIWTTKSDTENLYFLTFLQVGFWERNEVSLEILRFNPDTNLLKFKTRVVFEKKRVLYVDTLWDSIPVMYKKWRVLIPALSSSFYGALFDGEPVFESEGENFIIWLANREYDDSIRFFWGDNFLETKGRSLCKTARIAKSLNLFVLGYDDFERGILNPVKEMKVALNDCEVLNLPEGKFALVLENLSGESVDVVIRLAKIDLIPKEVKKYKFVKFPKRVEE